MSSEERDDQYYKMVLERQHTYGKAKAMYRRTPDTPTKGLIIAIPFDEFESWMRKSQFNYYLSTVALCQLYHYEICLTHEDLIACTESYVPFDELRILAHGDVNGEICFPYSIKEGYIINKENRVKRSTIFDNIQIRGDCTGFKTHQWIHCYNHEDLPDMNEKIINYQLRRQQLFTTSPEQLFTYNIPREFADGQKGYVHSALNPEILDLGDVRLFLDLSAQKEKINMLLKNEKDLLQIQMLQGMFAYLNMKCEALKIAAVNRFKK